MNKICGYSCEHNKSGVCQITSCDRTTIITGSTNPFCISLEEIKTNELLYNQIYDSTKKFGRNEFIKEIMRLQRENKELKNNWDKLVKWLKQEIQRLENYMKSLNYLPHGDLPVSYYKAKYKIEAKEKVLDKMQEIKGSNNK